MVCGRAWDVLCLVELEGAAHTVVGAPDSPGVLSTYQCLCLAVAVQLLSRPDAIFLEEVRIKYLPRMVMIN